MREYKFRGKRIDNGEWAYGDLTRYSESMSYITVDLIENEVYKVDTSTVGQYIGLCDKNGKEGYGSDILNTPVGRAVIRFGEYSSPSGIEKHIGFYIEFTDGNYADLYRKDIGYWMPLSEIIGNIHDNSELLEVSE